jgi:large subunit ribosomal protein L18
MITKIDKNAVRQKRHARVRKTVTGTATTPRMNVYRSLNHIYVQVIDDRAGDAKGGVTIVAASTMDKAVKEKIAGLNKVDAAKVVGAVAAERAMAKGIQAVVFDRGGYLYTGRVKAVADGAREAGLNF